MNGVEENARTVAEGMESDNGVVEKVHHETENSFGEHRGSDFAGTCDIGGGCESPDDGYLD